MSNKVQNDFFNENNHFNYENMKDTKFKMIKRNLQVLKHRSIFNLTDTNTINTYIFMG